MTLAFWIVWIPLGFVRIGTKREWNREIDVKSEPPFHYLNFKNELEPTQHTVTHREARFVYCNYYQLCIVL